MSNRENMHLVRQAREEMNLTREELAFKAGTTVRTIERIEGGHVSPHRVTQRAIAAVLERDPELLWPRREQAA